MNALGLLIELKKTIPCQASTERTWQMDETGLTESLRPQSWQRCQSSPYVPHQDHGAFNLTVGLNPRLSDCLNERETNPQLFYIDTEPAARFRDLMYPQRMRLSCMTQAEKRGNWGQFNFGCYGGLRLLKVNSVLSLCVR